MASSSNEADEAADKSGVLSRTSLYAPLSTYTRTSSANNKINNKVKKTLQEASLVDFWSAVSANYHYQKQSLHARNTGHRPLTVSEINGRIRQRALTLVGGGYNSQIASGDTAKQANRSQQKRQGQGQHSCKRRRRNRQHNESNTTKISLAVPSSTEQPKNTDDIFLRELHQQWLEYMRNILDLSSVKSSSSNGKLKKKKNDLVQDPLQQLSNRVAQVVQRSVAIELVGASVRILACARHPSYVGLAGILVAESSETYTVAEYVPPAALVVLSSSRTTTLSDVGETAAPKESVKSRTWIIPKRASSLGLMLPVDRFTDIATSADVDHRRICIVVGK
jgi:RNase P/RNase MRP subunit p29